MHSIAVQARRMSKLAQNSAEAPVLFGRTGKVGTVLLNKPKVLNSLNMDMVRLITPKYKEWYTSPDIVSVVIKGSGPKAFCAGGDIVAVREMGISDVPISKVRITDFVE